MASLVRSVASEVAQVIQGSEPAPVPVPRFLAIYWPFGGQLHAYGTGTGDRVDYAPLTPPSATGQDPGKEFAGRFTVIEDLPGGIYLAWWEGTTVYVVNLVTGDLETHTGAEPRNVIARGTEFWWTDKAASIVQIWKASPGGSAEMVSSAEVGAGGNSGIDAWHREHFVTQYTLSGSQVAAIDPDTGSFTVHPVFSTVLPATGTKAPPSAAGDRFSVTDLGSCYGGPAGYSGGKLRIHTGTAASYSAGFFRLSSGAADSQLNVAAHPWAHARVPSGGAGLFCFPYDSPGTGKWFDPGESSAHSRNASAGDKETIETFDSDPLSHPHAVIPLAAQPPWAEE